MRSGRLPRWIAPLLLAAAWCPSFRSVGADSADLDFFEKRIRPVLAEHCYECHSTASKKLKGGLKVDSRAALLTGGDTRTAIVPGEADGSLLIEAVRYGNANLQMPPKHRLPDAVVADLENWVNRGAPFPEGEPTVVEAKPAQSKTGKEHWAFQPIREVEPPAVSRALHPVDRFIQARLADQKLSPAPPAGRRTLIRRAYFDLLGLPPSPEEVEVFVADTAPDAFERLVDHLLASPRYGERWGRWWLDLARYADTNGQDENKVMSNAWRYRDWVVNAFNSDLPFDEFTTAQLAGDLLPTNGVPEEVVFSRWTATGLLVMGPKMLAEQDKPKLVMDLVDEQIDVVSRAFLGLTVGCARCHDHKFDPIPTRDYYALAGIFKSTRTMENLDFVSKFNERRIATREQLAAIETYERAFAAKTNQVEAAIRDANAALLAGWKAGLGQYLRAAVVPNEAISDTGPGSASKTDPAMVTRLRELLAPDPATNTLSQTLHALAGSPERLTVFLADTNSIPATPAGLRLAPGKVGAAFVATGDNQLELPHQPALDPAQLTVEAWVRVSEFPKDGDTRRWLVNKNSNEWVEGHYALMIDRDRAGAYLNIGGGRENMLGVWSAEHVLKANQWHHLAFTYDSHMLRLFVDGQPAGETAINRPRVAGTTPLVVAKRQDGYNYFRGQLDEIHVFDHALSAAELQVHFAQPAQPVGEGVVARWEFNDLTEADRTAIALAEARETLFGPGGVLALPKDPRPLYPEATRETVVALERERDALKAAAPESVGYALAVAEDKPVDLPVHVRGSHLNLGKEAVPRGFVGVARCGEASPSSDHSGRLELARWLTHPGNPLTARVVVNRIWQAHFGEGLVRTPDNFGIRGESPTHPELLDWLAREFMRRNWSVKAMHRLLLSSATWQQASENQTPPAVDPDNRLLSHFPRQRLEAEMVRDALLAVSDRLDDTAGGSLVHWKNNEYVPGDEVSAKSVRRSIYLPVVRDRVYDVFTIFDFANPSVGQAKRIPTVVSHQALFFLNSPLVKESAHALASTILSSPSADDAERVRLAYQRAYARPPSAAETERAVRFLATAKTKARKDPPVEVWTALCQTLFASNEFVYRD